jgi:RND family efflux transporter MFP subunit
MNRIQYILTMLLLIILANACREDTTPINDVEAVKVKVAAVKAVKERFPVRSSGTLSSKTEAKLSFKTGGIIASVNADEGQSVKQGALLARLDLSEIQAQVRQAELAFEKAKRDLARVENLYRDSVATLENYQDAGTGLAMAESKLAIARFNLQYSQIVAPSDGRILKRLASANELIGSGMPVFLFAPEKEAMVVRVHLTDREIVRICPGDKASLAFDAYPSSSFTAKVTQIANAADPYTGTYEVEVELKPDSRKLISGFTARVEIFPAGEDGFLEIPVESLIDGRGREGFVFVAENGRALRKGVMINHIRNDKLIVTGELKPGDLVITEGAQYVNEAEEVEIVDRISN